MAEEFNGYGKEGVPETALSYDKAFAVGHAAKGAIDDYTKAERARKLLVEERLYQGYVDGKLDPESEAFKTIYDAVDYAVDRATQKGDFVAPDLADREPGVIGYAIKRADDEKSKLHTAEIVAGDDYTYNEAHPELPPVDHLS